MGYGSLDRAEVCLMGFVRTLEDSNPSPLVTQQMIYCSE
jgi:hypothetical protein